MLLSQSANSKCKATNTVLTACTNRQHISSILTSLPNKVHVKNKLLDTNLCFPLFEENSQAATLLWRTADLIQHFLIWINLSHLKVSTLIPSQGLDQKRQSDLCSCLGSPKHNFLSVFLPVLSHVLVSWHGRSTLFTSSPPWWSIKFMCAIWASIQPASWLASYHRYSLSVSSHILSQSHHRLLRLSSVPPPPRSWGLQCWDLRSCHLNCQSLWTSLTCKDVRLLMGDCDIHVQRGQGKAGQGKSNIAQTHTPGDEFMHDTSMNYLWPCMCIKSQTMGTGQRQADNTNTAAGTKG